MTELNSTCNVRVAFGAPVHSNLHMATITPPAMKGVGLFLIVMSTNSNFVLYRTNCELRRFFSYSLPSSGWPGLSGNARLLLVYVHCKSVARLVL